MMFAEDAETLSCYKICLVFWDQEQKNTSVTMLARHIKWYLEQRGLQGPLNITYW